MRLFLSKIALFTSLVFLSQILTVLIYPGIVKTSGIHSKIINAINTKSDIIYFGDSTIRFTHPDDKDLRPTSEILSSALPGKKLISLNHDAFDSTVYSLVTNHLVRTNKTKYLIIPVNLRSFGYKWETSVAWQFYELKAYLNTYNTPYYGFIPVLDNLEFFKLLSFPQMDSIYEEDIIEEIHLQKNSDREDSRLKEHLLLDYFYILTKNSRKLKSLIIIAEETKKSTIIPIFYITPIDYQYSQTIYADFKKNPDQNIRTLKDSLKSKNMCLLDLSYSLPTSNFAWRQSGLVNEHLDENGRKFIASKIRDTIDSIENNQSTPDCSLESISK